MMATEISIPTLTGSTYVDRVNKLRIVEAADTGMDSCNGTE